MLINRSPENPAVLVMSTAPVDRKAAAICHRDAELDRHIANMHEETLGPLSARRVAVVAVVV